MGIRQANLGDLEQILAIYAPFVEQTAVSFEYDVPTLQDFRQRFCRITEQFPWLVWEQDGKILGYAYASAPFSRDAWATNTKCPRAWMQRLRLMARRAENASS